MRNATLGVLLFALLSGSCLAADPERGRLLYETHCGSCHYERVHDRKKTLVSSMAALKLQIAKWAAQSGRRFTPAELDDVAEYLNQSHYRIAQ